MQTLSIGSNSLLQVGAGLLDDSSALAQAISGPDVVLVCGQGLPEELKERTRQTLARLPVNFHSLDLPDREADKTLSGLQQLFDHLLQQGCGRDATLVALGGGVTGDMTGFAAACYQRGIPWINLPTTLLAQADACIGGKTAVNHPLGKNMIGAFHPPTLVLADIHTLTSLPDRHLRAGLAEIIKHAFIADSEFLDWLETHMSDLLARVPEALEQAVWHSCRIKAAIVEKDERERGERALLNFGHSFAHAIENHQDYRGLLHGEAVAIGMALAARFSHHHLGLTSPEVERVEALLKTADLPIHPPADMGTEDFLIAMRRDKKVADNRMRLVLLPNIGTAELTEMANERDLARFLDSLKAGAPPGR